MTLTPIETLHATWCREASHNPQEPLRVNIRVWERAYADFLSKGYTEEDLAVVIRHVKYVNKKEDKKFSLRQNKFFDFEYMHFDSLLQEAQARNRNRRPAPTEKEKAIESLRPVVDPEQASTIGISAGRHISELFRKL